MEIYEASEDSFLLQQLIKQFALGRVLDMGTGSGILAETAAKVISVREVVAADKNLKAINTLKQKNLRKITPLQSDLFSSIKGYFDLIICNPPYLPQDKGINDIALYGGKHGWEFTEKFFSEVASYLAPKGTVLYLFSSLTNKEKVEEIITQNLFVFEEIAQQKLSFETLYVYKIVKSPLRRSLEKRHIHDIHYLTHGQRGNIYTGFLDKKDTIKTHFVRSEKTKIAIKIEREESTAEDRITNEIIWLKKLNKKGIGPQIIFTSENFFVYHFVEGKFFLDWLQEQKKPLIANCIKELLQQCHTLDLLKVNKEELHRPHKHILVDKNNLPVMLDFERCYETKKPSNVTQFVEFLRRIHNELQTKGFQVTKAQLTHAAKLYKESYRDEAFQALLSLF